MKKIIYLGLVLVFSCSQRPYVTRDDVSQKQFSNWQQLSLFMSGMPVTSENKYYSLTKTAVFKKHTHYMNTIWKQIEKNAYCRIKLWRRSLPVKYPDRTAIYPLSGADFLNLFSMFPQNKRYIMMALEDPGDPLLISAISRNKLDRGLQSLRYLIYSYAAGNYFTSKMMNIYMKNPYLTGVLPMLMITMPRLGLYIKSVEPITIAENGKIVSSLQKRTDTQGIRIIFYTRDKPYKRELIYIKLRISDDVLNKDTRTGRFFSRLKKLDTLLKSAVYLFHNPKYSGFKNYLLTHSRVIIQDDSGIPYKFFDRGEWDIHLYGNFTKPLRLKHIFPPNPVQPDLASAYRTGPVSALPFSFGYGYLRGDKQSNLMLAVKK